MKYLIFSLELTPPLFLLGQSKFEYQYRTELSYNERVALGERHSDKYNRGKGIRYKQFKRRKYWAQRSLDQYGYVITKRRAGDQIRKFNSKYNASANLKSLSPGTMIELGPKSTTITASHSSALGKLLSIAVANDNSFNHLIVASDGGVVWKTLDGRTNWIPIFDTQPNMDVNAVEISHANSQHYFAGLEATGVVLCTDGGTVGGMDTYLLTNGGVGTNRTLTSTWIVGDTIPFFHADQDALNYITRGGGNNYAGDGFPGIGDASFTFPVFQHPINASTINAGADSTIYKSIDRGTNWTTYPNFQQMGTINYADIGPSDGNVIYEGTQNGEERNNIDNGIQYLINF